MAKCISLVFAIIFSFLCSCKVIAANENREEYIVYMGSLPEGPYLPTAHHLNLLQEVIGESSAKDYLFRSYKNSFNGFAARLTKEEQKKLANTKGIVSVFPNTIFQLQTTRSWDFMGVNNSFRRLPDVESNIIIGVLDSGITPKSRSFSDEGFGPLPKKWKGACEGGQNFTCNKKLIGARYFGESVESAFDSIGHGTHTASTAAGNLVKDVSFYGLAEGTARGGVPSARIAAYKVCTEDGCKSADILSGFDQAIADGVDIITVSLGRSSPIDFDSDSIAIGAFHAIEKGILTVNSAGNTGPFPSFISSVAPWLLSVAASSTDRRIIDKLILGSGKELVGTSINTLPLPEKLFPLVYGLKNSNSCSDAQARDCFCLDENLVKGKIVVCNKFEGMYVAIGNHAAGLVGLNDGSGDVAFTVPIPAVYLTNNDTEILKSYLESARAPQAKLLKSETVEDSSAPVVASFSSRGPNRIAKDILKPDITAPGVEILAAYSPVAPLTEFEQDKRSVNYNIISGTSMSCPHIAGIAAYIKTIHPDWSPSTIKSAIMTTAWPMSPTKNPDAEFAYGAGHVDPVKAVHPGLVYQLSTDDYTEMLCSLGYDESRLALMSGNKISCSKEASSNYTKNFNYPSLTSAINAQEKFSLQFQRKVTNVGTASSTYVAKVSSASKIKVSVKPSTLSFKSVNETKSFTVTVTGGGLREGEIVSASLVWSDKSHSVRSPIVVYVFPLN